MAWQNLHSDIEDMFSILAVPELSYGDGFRVYGQKRKRDTKPTNRPLGRPVGSGKTQEKAAVLALVSSGVSMREAAKRLGVNRTSVMEWCGVRK